MAKHFRQVASLHKGGHGTAVARFFRGGDSVNADPAVREKLDALCEESLGSMSLIRQFCASMATAALAFRPPLDPRKM